MPQAFQARKFFIPKTDPKQEVYKPVPYYFGTLSTQDAADQIAEESSLTKGDVLNVLDRYQRYVIKNLQKGYKVELLGFGTVYNRFVTEKGVATAPEVKADADGLLRDLRSLSHPNSLRSDRDAPGARCGLFA